MVGIVRNCVESFNVSFAKHTEYLKSPQCRQDCVMAAKVATKVALSVLASLTIYVGGAIAVVAITTFIPGALPFQAILVSALVAGVWKDIGGPLGLAKQCYKELGEFKCLKTSSSDETVKKVDKNTQTDRAEKPRVLKPHNRLLINRFVRPR